MYRHVIKTAAVGLVGIAVIGASVYHREISDWWFLRSYQPPPPIAELAREAAMSDKGRDYFYVSDPKIHNKKTFNQNCPTQEKASVLGCYTDRRIYIMRVERQELEGVMEVTAAHEMLHAAYDRLDDSTRSRVADLLEDEFARIDDARLIRLIQRYEKDGGTRIKRNELHSILPTQVSDLSPELEEYYSRYFSDRQQVTGLYQQYESTFESIRKQIESLQGEIEELKRRINTLEGRIDSQRQRIDTLNARLERLQRQEDIDAYNELVPEQNAAVNEYNRLVGQYRSLISRHNRKVEKFNENVLLQHDLVNSLDSTYQELE